MIVLGLKLRMELKHSIQKQCNKMSEGVLLFLLRAHFNNMSPAPAKHPAIEQTIDCKGCWMCSSRTAYVCPGSVFPTLSINASYFGSQKAVSCLKYYIS